MTCRRTKRGRRSGNTTKLADQLIASSSKEELAECVRLLAMNVAHYQGKCGELPLDETLAMLGATRLNAEQEQFVATGMEILVRVLGVVRGLKPDVH